MTLKTPIKLYSEWYTLEQQVSKGGYATIYKALEQGRAEPVAVKLGEIKDDPAYKKSIIEESRILQQFTHNQIVKILPIPGPKSGTVFHARAIEISHNAPYFFVMEYLSGGTLEEYVKQMGKLTVGESAAIAVSIARALHHVHRVGWAHNDLKLENIVFRHPVQQGEKFDPVLIDFGIATRTQVQTGAGSIYIMSPEQLEMVTLQSPPELQDNLDKVKADVWGLGVVLYRMLGGRLPFSAHNDKNTIRLIMHSRPTSLNRLSQIPDEVDQLIIDGCLAKDPHHRLSMLELGKSLNELSKGVVASRSAKASTGWFW